MIFLWMRSLRPPSPARLLHERYIWIASIVPRTEGQHRPASTSRQRHVSSLAMKQFWPIHHVIVVKLSQSLSKDQSARHLVWLLLSTGLVSRPQMCVKSVERSLLSEEARVELYAPCLARQRHRVRRFCHCCVPQLLHLQLLLHPIVPMPGVAGARQDLCRSKTTRGPDSRGVAGSPSPLPVLLLRLIETSCRPRGLAPADPSSGSPAQAGDSSVVARGKRKCAPRLLDLTADGAPVRSLACGDELGRLSQRVEERGVELLCSIGLLHPLLFQQKLSRRLPGLLLRLWREGR